jgi:phosphoribosylglycinamide formyltransferase-1
VFRNNFQSQLEFKTAVLDAARKTSPDIVALAGFMVVLQPDFVNEFSGRLINIHPSLLPKFPGLDTHRRALAAHEAEHGTSVHFVATGVDTGALIAQGKVPVLPSDSPEILAERTLKVEHQLYPWVVSNLAKGAIALRGDSVEYSDLVRSEAEEKGFIIPGL